MITRDPNDLPYEAYKNLPLREYQMADDMFSEIQELPYTQIYQKSNRTEGYREEKGWDLLFVNEEPRYLKPAEDSRYSVRWNESRGANQIDRHATGDDQALYPASLQIDSRHKLCLPCHDLLNDFCQYDLTDEDEDDPKGYNVVVWHSCIASLVFSVTRHECFVCNMMETYISGKYPSLLSNAIGLTDFRLEVSWDVRRENRGMRKLYFVAVDSRKPKHPSSNYFHFAVMCAWPGNIVGIDCIKGQDHTEYNRENGGQEARRKQLASYWIDRCVSDLSGGHNTCVDIEASFVPARLLDVKFAQESGKVRLVCQDSTDDLLPLGTRYCTLSHCWGKDGSKSIPLLQKSNLDHRSSVGMLVSELPATFREAMDVCRWFDVRYLWIDSLCIIQDSEKEWRKEASVMSKIYRSAWLNISADVGGNAQAGIFRDISLTERTWPNFRATESQSNWTLTPIPEFFFQRIREAPSFSRAWIHRERQLSRRILHFTAHGMAWECCREGRPSYATESFPEGLPFDHFLAAENKYQVGRLEQKLIPGDEETYARWNDVCEVLSTKQLTKESDRPLILSTIAEDFSHLLPDDEYVAGLWRSTLPHSLLWYHPIPRQESKEKWATWAQLGPSWSWLSGQHRVTLANRARVKHHIVVAEMVDLSLSLSSPISPVPQDPFGRVGRGTLKMRGYLRFIRLRLQYEEQTWKLFVLEENVQRSRKEASLSNKSTLSVTNRMRHRDDSTNDVDISAQAGPEKKAWRYIGNSWDANVGDFCKIDLDWQSVTDPYDCFAFFVTLDEYPAMGGRIECLLLEQEPKSMHTFRRFGKLTLNREFALKMRYRVSSHEAFDVFDDGVDMDGQTITPEDWINALQQQSEHQKKGRGEDSADDDRANMQGVDGLYQFDWNVEHAFSGLVKLDPTELEII